MDVKKKPNDGGAFREQTQWFLPGWDEEGNNWLGEGDNVENLDVYSEHPGEIYLQKHKNGEKDIGGIYTKAWWGNNDKRELPEWMKRGMGRMYEENIDL